MRVQQLTADGQRPLPAELGYPGTDGMSTNRERFSIPSDVLWPHHPTWGVVAAQHASIEECRFASGDGQQKYALLARHDPTVGNVEKNLPENYAHSLVCTTKPPSVEHVESPRRLRENKPARNLQVCSSQSSSRVSILRVTELAGESAHELDPQQSV